MSGDNDRKDADSGAGKPAAHEKKSASDPLKIVRAKDPAELDLDVGEVDGDRRYGREDIADK